MEPQPCNIIAYLAHYGPFLNRITSFLYSHVYPQCCNVKNNSAFTRVESKCQTTSDTIIFALTGKFDGFRMIQFNELTLDHVMNQLYRWNIINISISCKDKFGGHNLVIIKDENVFYIIQSYIFEYNLKVHIANEEQIKLYISHYLNIFDSNQPKWTKNDINLWKCITTVNIPKYNDIKPMMFISWWYSYPYPFSLNTNNCQQFVRNLLEKALIRIENLNLEDIEDVLDVFDNPEMVDQITLVEEIKDDIEQLLADLDLLYYYDQVFEPGKLTESGCLID